MRRFRKVYIEIINICDLSCEFCPRTRRAPRAMDRPMFGEVLRQLDGIAGLLHFHVVGEPLLHPEIGALLALCGQRKLKVNLVTNGMSLESIGPSIVNEPALRQVCISLQSACANPGVCPAVDYARGIAAFVKLARRRADLLVSMRLWAGYGGERPGDSADVPAAVERALGLRTPLRKALHGRAAAQLDQQVSVNLAPRFAWPDLDSVDLGRSGTCLGLREQFAILSDGTVVPCCLDKDGIVALGNIADRSLREILAGERALEIREGFRQGRVVEELCRRCSYRLRFDREVRHEGTRKA